MLKFLLGTAQFSNQGFQNLQNYTGLGLSGLVTSLGSLFSFSKIANAYAAANVSTSTKRSTDIVRLRRRYWQRQALSPVLHFFEFFSMVRCFFFVFFFFLSPLSGPNLFFWVPKTNPIKRVVPQFSYCIQFK